MDENFKIRLTVKVRLGRLVSRGGWMSGVTITLSVTAAAVVGSVRGFAGARLLGLLSSHNLQLLTERKLLLAMW